MRGCRAQCGPRQSQARPRPIRGRRFLPHEAEAGSFRESEDIAEPGGRSALFVAADAEGDHAIVHPLGRQFRHLHGMRRAKVADGIEYPMHLDRRIRRCLTHGSVNGPELLPFPEHYTGGKGNFGIPDLLGGQARQ